MKRYAPYVVAIALGVACVGLLVSNSKLRTMNTELVAANQRLGHVDDLVAKQISESMKLRCQKPES